MADCSKTVEFFEELFRQKRIFCPENIIGCDHCPIEDCRFEIFPKTFDTTEAIRVLQEWSDKNPAKTRKIDFLEKFPQCEKIGETDYPVCCPSDVYGLGIDCDYCLVKYGEEDCKFLWDEVIE